MSNGHFAVMSRDWSGPGKKRNVSDSQSSIAQLSAPRSHMTSRPASAAKHTSTYPHTLTTPPRLESSCITSRASISYFVFQNAKQIDLYWIRNCVGGRQIYHYHTSSDPCKRHLSTRLGRQQLFEQCVGLHSQRFLQYRRQSDYVVPHDLPSWRQCVVHIHRDIGLRRLGRQEGNVYYAGQRHFRPQGWGRDRHVQHCRWNRDS